MAKIEKFGKLAIAFIQKSMLKKRRKTTFENDMAMFLVNKIE